MKSNRLETKVVIIGAGVSGLSLATFLKKFGIDCITLELQSRTWVEMLQRAGALEGRAIDMFERWEMGEILGGPVAQTIEYRINGSPRVFEVATDDGSPGRFCTQQMLVTNLLKKLIDEMRGDVRFSVADLNIRNGETLRPQVNFTDASGSHEIVCDYIVGCDGSRGVSRTFIPEGVLTQYTHEFGYAWLAVLVEAPLAGHPLMGISDHGFVAQLPRGPQRSRYYLQCNLSDSLQDWSDERVWNEIRLRTNDKNIMNANVLDKTIVPLRCVQYAPMQYRNLFLAGDVAHLVPPTGAKGMNLALYDVDVLAEAFLHAARENDFSKLERYSETVLPRLWKYQEFSVWMTDTMHDAGDPTLQGRFKQMIARARLDTLFSSKTANDLHSDFMRGKV